MKNKCESWEEFREGVKNLLLTTKTTEQFYMMTELVDSIGGAISYTTEEGVYVSIVFDEIVLDEDNSVCFRNTKQKLDHYASEFILPLVNVKEVKGYVFEEDLYCNQIVIQNGKLEIAWNI